MEAQQKRERVVVGLMERAAFTEALRELAHIKRDLDNARMYLRYRPDNEMSEHSRKVLLLQDELESAVKALLLADCKLLEAEERRDNAGRQWVAR